MDYEKVPFERLMGNKILSLELGNDDILRFTTPDEIYMYMAVGDCCSSSWFNDIIGVDYLIGATVQSVRHGRFYCEDEYGEMKVYSLEITTDKGFVSVIFRNSSNGYYGGWVEYLDEDTFNHYYRFNEKQKERIFWRQVTEDFG